MRSGLPGAPFLRVDADALLRAPGDPADGVCWIIASSMAYSD
jgi:hypothetical protein